MKVFYINIDEFKTLYPKDFLTPFADIGIKTEKRFFEYTLGRYLVTKIAKEKFNFENPEIITDNKGKPFFKNSELHFSISHSKNMVGVVMDKAPCGIDIEFEKPRNLKKLSKYFNQKFETLEDFYKFWTFKEAVYKINDKIYDKYFSKFGDYYITIVSNHKIDEIEYINALLNKKT